MKISTIILLFFPFLAAILLFFVKLVNAVQNQGAAFNFYTFIEQNFDLTIAVGLIILQTILTGYTYFVESQDPIPGKWDVEIIPSIWKGQSDVKVLGKGSMLLSKAPYNTKRYVGYLQLTYKNETNEEIIRGLYEISFTKENRKKLAGQSYMISRQHTKDATTTDSPVVSWVRPCIYRLNFDKKSLKLNGTANMKDGNTKQLFNSYKSAN